MGRSRRHRPAEVAETAETEEVRLPGGAIATIVESATAPGTLELLVDGTLQSQVDPEHPAHLLFEYLQRIANLADQLAEPAAPLTAVHLGAGALALPRYVEATRPGSRQQVIELEPAIVDLVRNAIPLPRRAHLRIRYGDARDVANRLPPALDGTVDLVVVDVYAGTTMPAHLSTTQFFAELRPLLAPRGIIAVNVADSKDAAFARSEVATLRAVFPHVLALSNAQFWRHKRAGNVILAASNEPWARSTIDALRAAGPHPAAVVFGEELGRLASGFAPRADPHAETPGAEARDAHPGPSSHSLDEQVERDERP